MDSREERRKKAVEHYQQMLDQYSAETSESVNCTVIHDFTKVELPVLRLQDCTTSDALTYYADQRICVLNFASYTRPGGGFIKGSIAQEECLCHDSNLYNILSQFEDVYKENMAKTNFGIYNNFAIWTPNVQFVRPIKKKVDVISCPAPNLNEFADNFNKADIDDSAWVAYQRACADEYKDALRSRCKYVLDVAKEHGVSVLVLGAFGCGVFGNKPEMVAEMFKDLLLSGEYQFKEVMFAVPNSGKTENYEKFSEVLKDVIAR